MFDRLAVAEQRFNELNEKACDMAVISDPAQYRDVMKEIKQLTPLVETYREYSAAKKSEAEAKEMLEAGGLDAELSELAQLELEESKERIEQLSEQLKILLLPRDPNDDRNVIIEIRGGAGGDEAALFSAVLTRMYTMYAEQRGWKTEIINVNETELGGYKEVSFMINGDGAFSRFKFESGVHRVQRVPETESQGRIHTSTVTVAVLPEAEDVEIEVNMTDLKIDTYRSSGAGGQHVNTTDSAVRITHMPTGLVVECQDERSQIKNREKAMRVLRARLWDRMQQEQMSQQTQARRAMVGSGDRSERVRTYNYPQGRVTDHRIGLTLYKLELFLQGDMDEIVDQLVLTERQTRMEQADRA